MQRGHSAAGPRVWIPNLKYKRAKFSETTGTVKRTTPDESAPLCFLGLLDHNGCSAPACTQGFLPFFQEATKNPKQHNASNEIILLGSSNCYKFTILIFISELKVSIQPTCTTINFTWTCSSHTMDLLLKLRLTRTFLFRIQRVSMYMYMYVQVCDKISPTWLSIGWIA